MTTYKEISGQLIRTLSSDPANPQTGQIWYNSTIGVLKGQGLLPGAWSSGGNMINSYAYRSGAGTQTAGLAIAGFTSPGGGVQSATEEYDGATWTAGGAINTARFIAASGGTQTSAFYMGGQTAPTVQSNATEEYNGSSWTTVNTSPNYHYENRGCGTQTAGLSIAGQTAPGGSPAGASPSNNTEEYDGTSWTAGGNYPVSGVGICAVGSQTATIAGGQPGSPNTLANEYNGSAWTAVGSLTTGGYQMGGSGDLTSALFFGNSPKSTVSQSWDGSAWASAASMANQRAYATDSVNGTSGAAFAGAGNPSPFSNATEEFSETIGTLTLDTN